MKKQWHPNKDVDSSGMKNKNRANHGYRAICEHQRSLYPGMDCRIIDDSTIVDLIADLLHFCDSKKIDGESVLRIAKSHWEAER